MKTAMQEFREWYNSYINENGSSPSDWDVNYFISHIFEPKEKEQIIDFAYGCVQHISREDIEKHYNKTYNNDEISTTIL